LAGDESVRGKWKQPLGRGKKRKEDLYYSLKVWSRLARLTKTKRKKTKKGRRERGEGKGDHKRIRRKRK